MGHEYCNFCRTDLLNKRHVKIQNDYYLYLCCECALKFLGKHWYNKLLGSK